MRNLRGIIVAGVFGVLTWLVQQLAQRYSLLLDMAYPFASKTVQELLGGWSAGVDFCVWQVILAVFLVAVVVSIGLMGPVSLELLPVAGLGAGTGIHRLFPVYLLVGTQLL